MKRQLYAVLAAIITLAGWCLVQTFNPKVVAQSPDGFEIRITSPVDGQQLFGLENIFGSAAHPTTFDSYTLEYNDLGDPGAPWLLVQPRIRQQVQNDILGAWNTNMVPDGAYQLRLRVYLTDGQVDEFIVMNLNVINSQPTPVPTAPAGAAGEATTIPTLGPSPTSPIQQPPSSNPALGDTSGQAAGDDVNGEAAPVDSASARPKKTRINMARVRSAFCSGTYLTLAAFAAILVYSLLRGRLRPYTRRLIWQIREDFDDTV